MLFFVEDLIGIIKIHKIIQELEGSVNWQATPHIGLEAWVSNEISAASTTVKLHHCQEQMRLSLDLRMNITGNPVKFEKSNYKKNMITQMTQPVKRKYDDSYVLERSVAVYSVMLQLNLN